MDFLWCVLVVFAVPVAAGLEVAGVCAALSASGIVARAKAKLRIVVFIVFSLAGRIARSQLHPALSAG
jgi:hypothetical protein